jgi:hypothetical protein
MAASSWTAVAVDVCESKELFGVKCTEEAQEQALPGRQRFLLCPTHFRWFQTCRISLEHGKIVELILDKDLKS